MTHLKIKMIILVMIISTNLVAIVNATKCDKVINKKVYNICYSYKYKGAIAVWYQLDGNLVNKNNIKKRPSFYNEKNIPMKYRSKSSDYTNSGYDRGHLANDASFDYDKKILTKVYSMANIIPQAPRVNRYTWIKAEKYARSIAVKLGSVDIINIVRYSKTPKRIGKNQISVPIGFYKKLSNENKNFEKCFYYENNNDIVVKQDKLKSHIIDCNTINF